jgi:8-oxo-dGTP pyrophosphatase MutT (NUDIX family)
VTSPIYSENSAAALARLRDRLDPLTAATGRAPVRSDHDLSGGAPGLGARPLEPAAVLAPLVERDGALWFVLTERAGHLPRHAGQVSFPGGRPHDGDADLVATALREAQEEIGLDPGAVEILGGFDAYETITGYCVTPYVGLVRGAFSPAPDPSEVADVFEAPFAFLMDPASRKRGFRQTPAGRRWFYETPYRSRYIWGATAGLLKLLSDRLYGGEA